MTVPTERSPYSATSEMEIAHVLVPALVEQVDDQLQLVETFVVRDLRL